MPILLLCLALVAAALVWRTSRVPMTHRWRRRQARIMREALCGRDRTQPPALIYARLRAMDAVAFEELLLESFESRGHGVIRNRRYTCDGGVDGQVMIEGRVWLIQAKRYASAIRPEHVRAFGSICTARSVNGSFIHAGRTGGSSREAVTQLGAVEIVSGQRLMSLITDAFLVIGGRAL